MPPYPIRRNAASCLATARFAFRRRPAASCRCHFLRLGGYRIDRGPQLLEGIGKQGRREGRGFPIAKQSLIETPLSKTIAKLRPRVTPVFASHERECNPDGIDAPLH
jgi:hypothetical protein